MTLINPLINEKVILLEEVAKSFSLWLQKVNLTDILNINQNWIVTQLFLLMKYQT
jgi:hypothetical protein